MAGYGTTMYVRAARDGLMALLMAAAQRRAEAAALDFGYRSDPDGDATKWTMQVDGHGFRIAAWSQQLERDLPTVAEGYPLLPADIAIGFANAIVARWFSDCIGRPGDEDDAPEAVIADDGGANRWWWPILATGFKDLSDETRQRLAQADWLVGRWIVGELPAETIIEEVHTIAEAVLRMATASDPKARWPQLVKAAREMRLLTSDDADVLTRFSRVYRNRLKHEAGILAAGEDDQALVGDVILVLDHVERFGPQPLTDEAEAQLAELSKRMTALDAAVVASLEAEREPHNL